MGILALKIYSRTMSDPEDKAIAIKTHFFISATRGEFEYT